MNGYEKLRRLNRWLPYQLRGRKNGKQGKVPCNPRTGFPTTVQSLDACVSYRYAVWASKNKKNDQGPLDGIGYVVGDGLGGIDLDDCIDDHGNISDFAKEIISYLDSYTEVSLSGKGVHILFYYGQDFPQVVKRRQGDHEIEVYSKRHYLVLTGKLIHGEAIEVRTEQAKKILQQYFPDDVQEKQEKKISPTGNFSRRTAPQQPSRDTSLREEDKAIIREMFSSKFGTSNKKLFYADKDLFHSRYHDDRSSLTRALLIAIKAFTKDEQQIDRIYRSSAVYLLEADKWDRPTNGSTWGMCEIQSALNYKPKRKRR